jgi:hypothetical protein
MFAGRPASGEAMGKIITLTRPLTWAVPA